MSASRRQDHEMFQSTTHLLRYSDNVLVALCAQTDTSKLHLFHMPISVVHPREDLIVTSQLPCFVLQSNNFSFLFTHTGTNVGADYLFSAPRTFHDLFVAVQSTPPASSPNDVTHLRCQRLAFSFIELLVTTKGARMPSEVVVVACVRLKKSQS